MHEERLFQASVFYRELYVIVKSTIEKTVRPAALVLVPNTFYPLASARRRKLKRRNTRPSLPLSHSMRSGLAMKIELYVPTITPTSITNTKL